MFLSPKLHSPSVPDVKINVNAALIAPQASMVLLGVELDNRLALEQHAQTVSASCRSGAFALRLAGKNGIPLAGRKATYNSLIDSRVGYCDVLLDAGSTTTANTLQKAQDNGLRALMLKPDRFPVDGLRNDLHWLSLNGRRTVHNTKLMWQCLHNEAPDILASLFQGNTDSRLRGHSNNALPSRRTNTCGQRTFLHRGTKAWNEAHAFIRHLSSSTAVRKATSSKNNLKTSFT